MHNKPEMPLSAMQVPCRFSNPVPSSTSEMNYFSANVPSSSLDPKAFRPYCFVVTQGAADTFQRHSNIVHYISYVTQLRKRR